MTTLIAGMIILFGGHLALYTPVRPALKARMGEGPFKGAFALVALIGLGLMIWGYSMTRAGPEAANILYWPAAGPAMPPCCWCSPASSRSPRRSTGAI
jgi:uncharacterized membrane protein